MQTLEQKINRVHELLQLTQRLGSAFAATVTTEAHADALLAAAESAYANLGRDVTEATGLGCPGNWFQCPDGSCRESESDCPGGGNQSAAA